MSSLVIVTFLYPSTFSVSSLVLGLVWIWMVPCLLFVVLSGVVGFVVGAFLCSVS